MYAHHDYKSKNPLYIIPYIEGVHDYEGIMAGLYQFSDSVPASQIIGAIAIYPADDTNDHHEVSRLSRDIVDRFIKTYCRGQSLKASLYAALARRMTAPTGGETLQNINMLHMLIRINDGEPIREDDALFTELVESEPIQTLITTTE